MTQVVSYTRIGACADVLAVVGVLCNCGIGQSLPECPTMLTTAQRQHPMVVVDMPEGHQDESRSDVVECSYPDGMMVELGMAFSWWALPTTRYVESAGARDGSPLMPLIASLWKYRSGGVPGRRVWISA